MCCLMNLWYNIAMEFKSFCLGKRGFSILGIIISAGLASGLAIVLIGITKEQKFVKKKTEAYFEISNLSYLIFRTIENGDACTQTLGTGTAIIASSQWTSIKNRDGEIILDKNEKYGHGLVEIQSIVPENIQIEGTTGEMILQVTFKKLDSQVGNDKKEVVKRFPLSIDVDDSGRLVRCRANRSNIVSTAKERMCRMVDGVFDPSTENCDLDHILLEGQKQICSSMDGVFKMEPSKCNMNSFVLQTVMEMCKSSQGTFNGVTGKCMLFSSSQPSFKDDDLLRFNYPYPICHIGFGAAIESGNKSHFGTSTFSSCFGPEVKKLFKLIKNEENIKVRTAPWKSHWLQYDDDGALERINFYRRPLAPYDDYRNKIYFVDNKPVKGLREMYKLVNIQIRMKYVKTGKWYTFTFAVGINYPNSSGNEPDGWRQAEQELKDRSKELFVDFQWLESWGN